MGDRVRVHLYNRHGQLLGSLEGTASDFSPDTAMTDRFLFAWPDDPVRWDLGIRRGDLVVGGRVWDAADGTEGKSYLTIAFGCTGGRHRSVFCAEWFGQRLREAGHHVTVRHRDLPV